MNVAAHQLRTFLERLVDNITASHVQSESDLEQLFQVQSEAHVARLKTLGIIKSAENATLLEILGYTTETVEDHPVRKVDIGVAKFVPDYVLNVEQKSVAIVDLKAPGISLEHEDWARQITTYCRELEVPLGLLFNGRELRVFINPDAKGLGQYKSQFLYQPVAIADYHELDQLIDLFLLFSCPSLTKGPTAVARQLANKRRKELADKQRQREIQTKLRELLANPSDDVLTAIATIDGIWSGLEPKPSEAEVLAAWKLPPPSKRPDEPKTSSRSGINSLLRQKVAEVCATKGWSYLESAQIKRLRFRNRGGNGYHLVPQREGVPSNLFVQGMPAEDAKQVLVQLEQLLSR